MLRSLAISQHTLGTREIVVIHHTQCGMAGFDDDAFRAELAADSGEEPGWGCRASTTSRSRDAARLETVRTCAWLPHRDEVRGFVFDVATARLTEIEG